MFSELIISLLFTRVFNEASIFQNYYCCVYFDTVHCRCGFVQLPLFQPDKIAVEDISERKELNTAGD